MSIKSRFMNGLVFGILVFFLISCEDKNEPLILEFEALNEAVIRGDFEKVENYLDSTSLEFVQKMSLAENMNADRLSEIGTKYDLELWCAEFYKYYSDHILQEANTGMFFKYLAMSETPLFQYKSDFELIPDKIKLGEKNFVAIAKHSGKYRYVNWLQYSNVGTSYKMNLLYLLRLEEGRSWNIEKTNAEYIHGKELPDNWRAEAVTSYYKTAKVTRPITIDNFDKRERVEEVEN